jgi:PTH2 family peptidyl-tRNA hydrolase
MLKQIFIINKDLKMTSGKIAVQVAHGEVLYIEMTNSIYSSINKKEEYKNWRAITKEDSIGMMKKVVLKSTESEIRDIFMKLKSLNIWCYLVFDKGLTQIPENSLTCLVVEPLEEEQCNMLFGDLKLL